MPNLVTLDAAFTSEMNHFNVCNRLQPVSTGNSALKQKFCCSINPENHSGKTDIFYVWLYCFDRQLHYENFLSLVAIYFLGILGQLGKHFLLGCVHNKEYFNNQNIWATFVKKFVTKKVLKIAQSGHTGRGVYFGNESFQCLQPVATGFNRKFRPQAKILLFN